jgi:colicin import membrane protein
MKKSILAAVAALALVSGAAQSQTSTPAAAAAPAKMAATASTDPVVVMRAEQRAARTAFNDATRPLRAERAAAVKAAEDKAMAEARAAGKDPLVARRNANRQATEATRSDFEAKMKVHTETRRSALAAATAKRDAAMKR